MILKYKIVGTHPEQYYLARRETAPCFDNHWHYHEDFELIYVIKSKGIRYIGNTIGSFEDREIYLTGSNLPHLFKHDNESFINNMPGDKVDLVIIHFKESFLGRDFMELPKTRKLKDLLQKSLNGLKFSKITSAVLHSYLTGLVDNCGLSGLASLLRVLDVLSISEDFETICSPSGDKLYFNNTDERLSKVIYYLSNNYNRKITLAEISEIANMTPPSFSRFFKTKTLKSFTEYLIEARIANASKLIIEGKSIVSEICYKTGFNTPSNFNRAFKKIMGCTPTEYIEIYSKETPR